MNQNIDYLSSLRGLFLDLSNSEMESSSHQLMMVIQIVRVGQMELKEVEKTGKKEKDGKTNNIRRPFGVCVIPFTQILSGTAENERNFKVYRVPADDDSMDTFTRHVALGESRLRENVIQNQNIPLKELGQLWLKIKTLAGNYNQVADSHPALVGKGTGCKIVQRLGFPEIIMPGALRNDFYLMLKHGEFEKSVKSHRSVQVEISVRYQNQVIPGKIGTPFATLKII